MYLSKLSEYDLFTLLQQKIHKVNPPTSFLKMELLELELVMVSRVAKRVPLSCSLFFAYSFHIVYRQVC